VIQKPVPMTGGAPPPEPITDIIDFHLQMTMASMPGGCDQQRSSALPATIAPKWPRPMRKVAGIQPNIEPIGTLRARIGFPSPESAGRSIAQNKIQRVRHGMGDALGAESAGVAGK
jgi:hypothetical protein